MINKEKPFDLLVVESPYEYRSASKGKLNSLNQLAIFCKTHQIPVRVHKFGTTFWKLTPQENLDDKYISSFFLGCDYRNGLYLNELVKENPAEKLKIMLTGGSLIYDDIALEEKWVESANLNPDSIANYDPKDMSRNFAIVRGCLAACADYVSREIRKNNCQSEVLIDTESAITDENVFHSSRTYRFHSYCSPPKSATSCILEILDETPPMM